MDHVYWVVTLFPGDGWSVVRMVKHGTLFAEAVEAYSELTLRERDQVLEDELTYVLEELLAAHRLTAQ